MPLRRVLFSFVSFALISASLTGCTRFADVEAVPSTPAIEPVAGAPLAVQIDRVSRENPDMVITYSGNVRAIRKVHIVPQVGGRLDKVPVEIGSVVRAGDLIAELDSAMLRAQLAQAEAAAAAASARLAALEAGAPSASIAAAEANLRAAQARLDGMREGGRPEVVAQAQASLDAAEAQLRMLHAGPPSEQIAIAEAQVRLARNQLYAVQSQSDAIMGSPATALGMGTPYTEDMRAAQTGVAYEQIKQAEAQLAALLAPPTPERIAQAQAAVDAARHQLDLARMPYSSHDIAQAAAAVDVAASQLEQARDPFSVHEIEAARAGLEGARAVVQAARLQVDQATIAAPFDGVIAQLHLVEGAVAGPTTPIVTLLSAEVEVVVDVEESRLAQVQVGQTATITATAYPGDQFIGSIVGLAPALDPRSRTIAVRIRPDEPGKLLEGMFVQVRIARPEQTAALLLPAAAVLQQDDRSIVYVVEAGRAVRREVDLATADGQRLEVLSGLSEGDQVIVSNLESLQDGLAVAVRSR